MNHTRHHINVEEAATSALEKLGIKQFKKLSYKTINGDIEHENGFLTLEKKILWEKSVTRNHPDLIFNDRKDNKIMIVEV